MGRIKIVLSALILVVASIFFVGCGDSNSPNDDKSDELKFPLEVGNTWNYIGIVDNSSTMELKVMSQTQEMWAPSFWNTTNLTEYTTYIIRRRIVSNNMPPTARYFAVSHFVVDDEMFGKRDYYKFGTTFHPLISNTQTLDFFVRMFDLPDKADKYIVSSSLNDNSEKFTSEPIDITFEGKTYKGMSIDYTAKASDGKSWGIYYEYAEHLGFVQFDGFKLVAFTKAVN